MTLIRRHTTLLRLFLVLVIAVATTSCATLSQVAALRQVEFAIDGTSGATLAGVPLAGKTSYASLGVTDVARLAGAVLLKRVPLAMTLHVGGTNPPTNTVTARLIQMDWTLFIDDRQTISGRLDREFSFPPGQTTDVPITLEVDLWEFFGGHAEDLFGLALGATGAGGRTMNLALKATPTIQTPIGPIRYPTPITIVQRTVAAP